MSNLVIFLGPPGAGKGTQAKLICEKYILNQFLGPWDTKTNARDLTKKNLPNNQTTVFNGTMQLINYDGKTAPYTKYNPNTDKSCWNSFTGIDQKTFKVVAAESWNFGKLLYDSSINKGSAQDIKKEKAPYGALSFKIDCANLLLQKNHHKFYFLTKKSLVNTSSCNPISGLKDITSITVLSPLSFSITIFPAILNPFFFIKSDTYRVFSFLDSLE